MPVPKVFISYSHDSQQHKDWVLRLATSLRHVGINVVFDQSGLVPGQDIAAFMANGIQAADRVVMICSEAYVAKAEARTGGAGYEGLIVTAEVVSAIDTIKFIPVIRNNASARKVPIFLGARMYVDFSDDADYDVKFEELARAIHGAPAVVLPPLGENPFKGEVIASAEPVRVAGPSGVTPAGVPILSDEWFQSQHKSAASGMQHLNVSASGDVPAINALGAMEVRLGLHSGLNKSPIELLNAVRTSQVHTFGWPIGVFSESKEEYKARPFGDGIRAEISIDDEDRKSYDYWTARKNGDFYVLQSFFEDQRKARNTLFFNTRIVRVTEALLFANKLYAALGAAPDARISARFTHRGLAGRTLTSSVINRYVSGTPKSHEPVSETEAVIVLRDIEAALVDEVERICAPMFMLFHFTQFAREVYEDIVLRFKKGEVS